MTTRRRSVRTRGPRRRSTWSDTSQGTSVADGAQLVSGLLGLISANDREGMTVTRVIGRLAFNPPATTSGLQRVDFGIGVIGIEAGAAGVVPDPLTDGDRPSLGWVYRDSVLVSDNSAGVGPIEVVRVQFDLKSRRRITAGNDLVLIVDNTNQVTTAFAVRVSGLIRVHLLLP